MHPAFMQVLLQYWTQVFGDSELSLRLPSTLFGLSAIVLTYVLGIKHFGRNAALFASAMLLFPVLPIIHSTLARPYAPGLFFIVLLIFAIFRLEDSRVRSKYLTSSLLIIIAASGSIYTHYYAGLCAGLIGISALFYVKIRRWSFLIISGVIAVLLFLPHWSITQEHLSRDGLGWLGAPEWHWFWNYLKLYFGGNLWLSALFMLLIPLGLIQSKFKSDNKARFLLVTFIALYFISHLISLLYTPILREPGVIMLMPLLLLGIGSFFKKIKSPIYNGALFSLSLVLVIGSVFQARLFETVHFEPFREMTALIKKYENDIGSDKLLKFCNVTNINYLNYYARRDGANLDFEMTMIEEIEEIHKLAAIIQKTDKPKVMLARTNRAQNVIQLEIIRNKFPKIEVVVYFNNANFNIWSRGDFNDRNFLKTIDESSHPQYFMNWNCDSTNNEFIGSLRIPVSELRHEESYLLLRTDGWISEELNQLNFVVVAERDSVLIEQRGAAFLYQAWNQIALDETRGCRRFYTAVELPEKLKDSDEIHVYFWNQNLAQVKIKKPRIYVVSKFDQ